MFEITEEIRERIEKLQQKYASSGQDMLSYLDGLLFARYLTYWDYIELDTLLTLQKPRTNFPDEKIFIVYHQITELYFLLIQEELDQVIEAGKDIAKKELLKRLNRIVNYARHLTDSFDVMTYGMDREQFLNFRMALLPASGFQTASYREIEFKITDLHNLLDKGKEQKGLQELPPAEQYPHLYWKAGNRELETGEKTLTLRMFEEKYDEHFLRLIRRMRDTNLRQLRLRAPAALANDPEVIAQYKALDLSLNVFWRLSHYKAAARYLVKEPEVIKATGGTNWQQYLPPRFQRVIFFPELWSKEEKAEWGKAWVLKLFEEQVESKWQDQLKQLQDVSQEEEAQ